MNDTIDLLQIKIEKAKAQLLDETLNAINAVDWKAIILGMRERKGYSFEQLGNLELETELVLCGLLNPKDYPKELENRMKISRAQANELVNEMNELVFAKIKEEMIKSTERKKIFAKKTPTTQTPIQNAFTKPISPGAEKEKKNDMQVLNSAGIKIIEPDLTIPELKEGEKQEKPASTQSGAETPPMSAQKLSGPLRTPIVETEHSLENITKTPLASYPPKEDPYRLPPE
ncbi:MAG: hypothetical protein AAB902_02855 [Patescibacteria group bacterium]